MWKKRPSKAPPVVGEHPDANCGEFVGKRLESDGGVNATIWEHEQQLSLLLSVDYVTKKGVMIGNLTIAGDESCRRKQIKGLIAILANLMEEN